MTVLRRLDCVLEGTKDKFLEDYERLKARGLKDKALHSALARAASKNRKYPLYNISKYTFRKLLEDPDHITKNLVTFINGFSPKAKKAYHKKHPEELSDLKEEIKRRAKFIKEFDDLKDFKDKESKAKAKVKDLEKKLRSSPKFQQFKKKVKVYLAVPN